MGTNMQSFLDGMALVGSIVIMVLVIALTYYVSRWYARRMNGAGTGRYLKIVDRASVSPGCSLVVVQAGQSYYLMALSEKNMQLICELPDFEPLPEQAAAQQPFSKMFRDILNKTAKGGSPKDDGGVK